MPVAFLKMTKNCVDGKEHQDDKICDPFKQDFKNIVPNRSYAHSCALFIKKFLLNWVKVFGRGSKLPVLGQWFSKFRL